MFLYQGRAAWGPAAGEPGPGLLEEESGDKPPRDILEDFAQEDLGDLHPVRLIRA